MAADTVPPFAAIVSGTCGLVFAIETLPETDVIDPELFRLELKTLMSCLAMICALLEFATLGELRLKPAAELIVPVFVMLFAALSDKFT